MQDAAGRIVAAAKATVDPEANGGLIWWITVVNSG